MQEVKQDETVLYYEMHQRNLQPFKKYPDGEAKKDGYTSEQNALMYQVAKDHQGMIKDLYNASKRSGHTRR